MQLNYLDRKHSPIKIRTTTAFRTPYKHEPSKVHEFQKIRAATKLRQQVASESECKQRQQTQYLKINVQHTRFLEQMKTEHLLPSPPSRQTTRPCSSWWLVTFPPHWRRRRRRRWRWICSTFIRNVVFSSR